MIAFNAHAGLSDDQAANIFDKEHGHTCAEVQLGQLMIGDQARDARYFSEDQFKILQAWSRAGLVSLQWADTAPTNMFLTGITKQVNVKPTTAGLDASKNSTCRKQIPQVLSVEFVQHKVIKIISNEEVKTAVDTFRVVKGTATNVVTDAGVKVYRELGIPTWTGVKFIMLLKLDSFTGEWKGHAIDDADIQSDFTSNNVEKALAAARH